MLTAGSLALLRGRGRWERPLMTGRMRAVGMMQPPAVHLVSEAY